MSRPVECTRPTCVVEVAVARPGVSARAFEISRQFPRISAGVAQTAIDRGWIR